MRPNHCRFHAAAVTATLVSHLVACLHLRDYRGSVPAALLARLLLLCAANGQSLSFNAQHCRAAPSDESVRLALKFNLPDTALLLLEALRAALLALVPARLRRRARPCALDLHQRPFYGDKDTPGISGGKHQAGTDYFWCYATLAVLSRGLRFTVGLCWVDRQRSLGGVVQTLVEQARDGTPFARDRQRGSWVHRQPGNQHECPQMRRRMRQRQVIVARGHLALSVMASDQIDIEGARAPTLRADPVSRGFEFVRAT